MRTQRRHFLTHGARLGASTFAAPLVSWAQTKATNVNWYQGELIHLIPTASDTRFLIKTSWKTARKTAPMLKVGSRRVQGVRTDTEGRFWRFDVDSLTPATNYRLQLLGADGRTLTDVWELKTFPAPAAKTEHCRILAYTCAGGYDSVPLRGRTGFLDMAVRQQLLARGLSFKPDVVLANGDHIYWDQKTFDNKAFAAVVKKEIRPKFGGELDLSLPMYHARNLPIFTAVCDYQIARLYGVSLRSTPAYFLSDDHDMFENDEFDDTVATLPVEDYGRVGAELTQTMYYPEFLPDANRPAWLPGGDKAGLPTGTNMCFGTLRYGRLLEAVMYDCRRYLDNKGQHARVVPAWVEDWLIARTRAEDTDQLIHMPSLPLGYSSGKLGDWYPDLLDAATGKLTLSKPKVGWMSGWHKQHQRLVAALAEQKTRAGVVVQGDFHASSAAAMTQSAELQLAHPVHLIMAGTLGTGDLGFPSAFRSIDSTPAASVTLQEVLKPTEKNGFTIIDVTPSKMIFSLYTWRAPQRVEEIDTMQPTAVYEVKR